MHTKMGTMSKRAYLLICYKLIQYSIMSHHIGKEVKSNKTQLIIIIIIIIIENQIYNMSINIIKNRKYIISL